MKLLVWDFDGTLAACDGRWSGTLFRMLEAAAPGRTFSRDELRAVLQSGFPWHTPEVEHGHLTPADRWWESLHPHFDRAFRAGGAEPELAATLAPRVRERYCDRSRWMVFADTVPTLAALSSEGWTHVVLSNHVPELPEIIGHLGLTPHFHRVVNSAATGFEKPHPQAYAAAVAGLGPLDDVWMIGDSMTADVGGAERFGWKSILVRESHPEARRQAKTLDDIPRILRQSLKQIEPGGVGRRVAKSQSRTLFL